MTDNARIEDLKYIAKQLGYVRGYGENYIQTYNNLADNEAAFSENFSLSKHSERVRLAKLVIAQNLGKERTILLLWGIRPGGRNHTMYTEARKMLDRLIRGED